MSYRLLTVPPILIHSLCRGLRGLFVAAIAATIATLIEIPALAGAPRIDPLYIRLTARPSPPQAALLCGGGRGHSAYEVYLTNFGAAPIKIVSVDVNGEGAVDQHLSGAGLAAAFAKGKSNGSGNTILAPNESSILFLFLDFDRHTLPDSFATSFTITGQGERGGSGTIRIEPEPLNPAPPITIHSPLRGLRWLAVNGPSNSSAHRRAVLFFNGRARIGQRYAIDWVQLGADGQTFRGDPHDNASYLAYNQEIHAVSDGTIMAVTDGLPDTPPNGKPPFQITVPTVAGNNVIQEIASGHFAAYAHLRSGTIRVKPGRKVRAGDVIGNLGSSGNSTEPHLHFQVCDAPSFVDCEGLPFAIDHFVRQDYRHGKGAGKSQLVLGQTNSITGQEPMEDELDNFGDH